MNNNYLYIALLCIATLACSGCVEENLENLTPAQIGEEILFGVRAGFENSNVDTKTIYSGKDYTVNGVTFERIDWEDDKDIIEIYSKEAINGPTAHYQIIHQKDADTQKDYASLTRFGDESLQWGDGDTHNFYAMYPSSKMFDENTTLAQGVKMDKTVLMGIIPEAQSPVEIIQDEKGNWEAIPDMRYAYMAAKGSATKADGKVSLTFVPVVTAVQVELVLDAGDYKPIDIAEISVKGTGIAGDFSADLDESSWKGTYPKFTYPSSGKDNIQVSLWRNDKPITIRQGQSLTFTVFLRPGQDYNNLVVSISPTGAAYVGKTIEDTTVPANLKTRINTLRLPKQEIVFDASNWLEQIDPQTELKKLSVPGTTGSFSYKYTSDQSGNYRSQHTDMNISGQWKAGIRAFEIVSDRPSSGSLGNTQVTCNKQDMNVTVAKAMEEIRDLVRAKSNEFAIVIFTYQPEGSIPSRNATSYASSLKTWYDNIDYKDMFKRYTPDLTIDGARGKIMVFVRLNQHDEKDGGSFSGALEYMPKDAENNPLFVFIDGCGTAKDKWGARGYTINGAKAPDISNSASTYIEQYMEEGYIDPKTHNIVRRGELNFGYQTNDPQVICWYQEWSRVIESNIHIDGGYWQPGLIPYAYPQIYWFESYNEKKQNAEDTFTMAISDQYSNYIFINSLSGYIAETDDSPTYSLVPSVGSAYGGDGGNIQALANKLNPDFYKFVLSAGMEQTTGPTGIVMMDYVSATPTTDTSVQYDGSYYLPGVIISNNMKYTIK